MLAATHMTNKHIRYIYKFPINAISIRMTPETVTFLWYYFLKTKTSKQNKQNLVNTMLKITTGHNAKNNNRTRTEPCKRLYCAT